MKAIAFRSRIEPDGTIQIPKRVRKSVTGKQVRVVLLWPETSLHPLTARQRIFYQVVDMIEIYLVDAGENLESARRLVF